MLVRPELARAAESRLHLVDHEQGPVLAAQLRRSRPVLVRGQVHALSLDDLEHERGDIVAPQLSLERLDLAEGNLVTAREQGAEPLPELLAPIERQRSEAEAVKGVVGMQHAGPLGRVTGELDRGLDRLGAGI